MTPPCRKERDDYNRREVSKMTPKDFIDTVNASVSTFPSWLFIPAIALVFLAILTGGKKK